MRASSWPARTVSPSRTVIWRTSPETFALTVACRTGCTAPDTGSQRDSGCASTRVRSRRREFEDDRRTAFPAGRFVDLLDDPHRDRAADGPDDHQHHGGADHAPTCPSLCHACPLKTTARWDGRRAYPAGPGYPGRPAKNVPR